MVAPIPEQRRSRPRRFAAVAVLTAAALAATAPWLWAHDFWLVPGAFPFAEGADVEVLGQTGTRFPTTESAVAVARVARAVIVDEKGTTPITDLSHRGKSLLLRTRPASPGQRVVAVDLQPRSARQAPAGFLRYLRLEGASEAAARLERDGALNGVDTLSRTDTKYAKALVDVGTRGPRAFTRSAGQPLEFMPQQDAATLRGGDTLRLRLVFRGQPVAGITAHAGPAPADSTAKPEPDIDVTSDADGVIRLPIARTGLWNIRAIHVVQAGSPASWETHWATFVFRAGR